MYAKLASADGVLQGDVIDGCFHSGTWIPTRLVERPLAKQLIKEAAETDSIMLWCRSVDEESEEESDSFLTQGEVA
jgi:hypothetical protein